MATILENINDRVSIRTYRDEKIPDGDVAKLKAFAEELTKGPFGTPVRFTFMDEREIMPAITPVGYPADRKSLKLKLIETVLQVRKRKDFSSIFFDGSIDAPLSKEAAREWAAPLEAVRIGPSASNKQPWRAVKTAGGFDFYADLDLSYDSGSRGFAVQKVDLGIACCHFDLVSRELALKGELKIRTPAPVAGKLTYVASWVIG